MKKGLWLFITILILIFSIPLKSNAAELYGVNVYIFHDTYNGSTVQEQQKIQYSHSYTSDSPMTVYLMEDISVPSSTYVSVIYFIVSDSAITRSDGSGEFYTFIDKDGKTKYLALFGYSRTYARPYTARIYMSSTGAEKEIKLKQYYTKDEFVTNYQNGSLNYDVPVDWENMQYNETIGYLQNVMLKTTDFKERDFEITWSNNNGQFMSDEWHVQIGWNTKFRKTLFGELYNWTNLEYVSWLDGLNYSDGKWSGNFDTMYSEIPECDYPSWWGSIYLRLVRVDSSTGFVEYGGWGQLSWAHKDDYGLTANYKTIKSSNGLDTPGVSESVPYQYIEDTEHATSQSYVINRTITSINYITLRSRMFCILYILIRN